MKFFNRWRLLTTLHCPQLCEWIKPNQRGRGAQWYQCHSRFFLLPVLHRLPYEGGMSVTVPHKRFRNVMQYRIKPVETPWKLSLNLHTKPISSAIKLSWPSGALCTKSWVGSSSTPAGMDFFIYIFIWWIYIKSCLVETVVRAESRQFTVTVKMQWRCETNSYNFGYAKAIMPKFYMNNLV